MVHGVRVGDVRVGRRSGRGRDGTAAVRNAGRLGGRQPRQAASGRPEKEDVGAAGGGRGLDRADCRPLPLRGTCTDVHGSVPLGSLPAHAQRAAMDVLVPWWPPRGAAPRWRCEPGAVPGRYRLWKAAAAAAAAAAADGRLRPLRRVVTVPTMGRAKVPCLCMCVRTAAGARYREPAEGTGHRAQGTGRKGTGHAATAGPVAPPPRAGAEPRRCGTEASGRRGMAAGGKDGGGVTA